MTSHVSSVVFRHDKVLYITHMKHNFTFRHILVKQSEMSEVPLLRACNADFHTDVCHFLFVVLSCDKKVRNLLSYIMKFYET